MSDKIKSEAFQLPRHKKIRGVALDMDGLLFDTERLYWEVGDTILQRRGHRYCKTLQERMMGRIGVAAIGQMIDFHSLPDSAPRLLEESDLLFTQILMDGVPQMQGVDDWIELLRSLELPFCLATSSRRKFVDILFSRIPWRESLAFILTGDDVTRGKPDPQMYQLAAEGLEVEPAEMLVLEDSGNGCAAGVAAGAYTVAVPSEHTRDQSFDGAKFVADTLADPRLEELVRASVG
jgi:HAD superfamily hydrolase (TIGR01509 family)